MSMSGRCAEGHKVMTRRTEGETDTCKLFGLAATGVRMSITGIGVDRSVGGRIVETWAEFDHLGLPQQPEVCSASTCATGPRTEGV
jgi:predicted ester cyclase